MSLVNDDDLGTGQEPAQAIVLQAHVRQQQMMVDHGDVGIRRTLASRHNMTLANIRTTATQAIVGRGGDHRPDAGVFRDPTHLADIPGLGLQRPPLHTMQLLQKAAAQTIGQFGASLQPIHAKIIRATLQLRHRNRSPQCTTDHRQVPVVELVLQRPGPGRNDHALPRQQCGHQIRDGLAGPGTRFDGQMDAIAHGTRHEPGHFQLFGPVGKPLQVRRQRAPILEVLVDCLMD